VFVVCMGKQSDSVFGHCDLARPRSLSGVIPLSLLTRGSGHVQTDREYGAGSQGSILVPDPAGSGRMVKLPDRIRARARPRAQKMPKIVQKHPRNAPKRPKIRRIRPHLQNCRTGSGRWPKSGSGRSSPRDGQSGLKCVLRSFALVHYGKWTPQFQKSFRAEMFTGLYEQTVTEPERVKM